MVWENASEWHVIREKHFEDAPCGGWTCRDCGAHCAAEGSAGDPEEGIRLHYAEHWRSHQ